jgi:hypothetical protein
MLPFDTLEMTRDWLDDSSRQDGRSILLTLASGDDNLPSLAIDVLGAELQAFMQPQSGHVQESDDHPRDSIEMLHDARDLLTAQDDGHANGHAGTRYMFDRADLDVQHVAIQEQHRAERLVLR